VNKLIVFIVYINTLQTFGQVVDDFSDGNFSVNPSWTAALDTDWQVNNGRLQSNVSVSNNTFQIVTPSTKALSAQWEFWVNLQFNTSSANYVDVFLTASSASLVSASNSGYFVRIGNTADEISLYRMTNGASAILINGANGVTNSSNNTVRVKVVRSANGLWTLERDAAGSTQYVLEGSVTDLTHLTSSFFGISVRQSTSSFFRKHFFDDIYAGDIIVENIPPQVQNIEVNAANALSIVFNEKVQAASSQNVNNYFVNNGIGAPVSAELEDDERTVALSFSNAFANGLTYQLNVSNVQDVVGNVMANHTGSFLYFVPVPATFNDVVINEILADPEPTVGLPAGEFIELYNKSAKPFDLGGWQITDGSSTGIFPTYILQPSEYLIVTSSASSSLFSSMGNTIGLSNFPTLNNSGDALKLSDASLLKIDSVRYESSWYQDADKAEGGWSLERLNPDAESNEPSNWRASEHATGGTPGIQNSLFGTSPDRQPPALADLQVVSATTLLLVFNEPLNANAADVENFSVEHVGSPMQSVLSTDAKSITLTFNPFVNGEDYVINIERVKDVAGNEMSATNRTFRYFIASPLREKDILISEIMADPSPMVQLPEAEYIELFSTSADPIDLNGWQLSDGTASAAFPSLIIKPQQYLIVTSTSNATRFQTLGRVIGVANFPSLNNAGESLTVKSGAGLLVDSVRYFDHWYRDDEKRDGGWSLERIDLANTCGEEDNWIVSEDITGGSPGRLNSVAANNPDVAPPQILKVTVLSETQLLVDFNEKLNRSFSINSFQISPPVSLLAATFTDLSLRQISISLQQPLSTRTAYALTVVGVADCAGNVISDQRNTISFAIPEAAERGDILINEILFNPKTGGVDFVELYNRSPKYVNLKRWQVSNPDDDVENAEPITNTDFILSPDEYLVVTSDSSILKDHYPRAVSTTFLQTSLPSFNDDAGNVVVRDSLRRVLDSLAYDDKQHSPLLKDTEGVSLERISLTTPGSEIANWTSATAAVGFATPGYLNSNARTDVLAAEGEVEISPAIFSPETGFSKISYNFPDHGWIANIRIYDQQGREVSLIANNETLGHNGFFIWDGAKNDGSRSSAGYYIVWFEVVDLAGAVRTFRKRVVVAYR